MKAVAVIPGKPDSAHLAEIPMPKLNDIAGGRGVLVKVLRVGMCGTDREINRAEYGAAPSGNNFLVLGHENFGVVDSVGKNVTELALGDFVTATVRRPGSSIYDKIGEYDMTLDDTYFERGINLRHGFLTEYYADEPEFIVKVPRGLKEAGVLLEPASVVEKGITQAFEIQRRLHVWNPKRAAVIGAGTVGLLASLALRIRGLHVCAFARSQPPTPNSVLLKEIGVCYHSLREISLTDASKKHGPFDLIFEATVSSPIVFEAMNVLGKNGVLVLSSVTGGGRSIEVPADQINLGFVLGNKVMVGTVNANRSHFESAVRDFSQAELQWPGWLKKLLTHKVAGLENFAELFRLLTDGKDCIKIFCETAPIP